MPPIGSFYKAIAMFKTQTILTTYFDYAKFSFKQRGFMQSLKIWISECYYIVLLGDFSVSLSEPFPQYTSTEYRAKGYLPYQASYYKFLRKALLDLLKLQLIPQQSTFIDIGAGKGKVVKFASLFGFKKVIGIEIEEKFLRIAEKKISLFKKKYNQNNITLYKMDAVYYIPEEKIDVVFLYNPVRKKALELILNNFINSSVAPKFIVYLNPVAKKVIEAIGYSAKISFTTGLYKEYTIFEYTK